MIKRAALRALALAVLVLVFAGSAAWGAEQGRAVILLPETASVQGAELLLGEIAEISGPLDLAAELAKVSAGTSPQPGSSRRLSRGQIQVRLRQAGIDPKLVEFQGAETVQVFRTAAASASSGAQQEAGIYQVVVAARDLKRGEVLSREDLRVEERELKSGPAEARSLEDFVGLRTTRIVPEGTAITELHVEAVPIIEKGAAVTILVHTGTLSVSAPGVARQSGGLGDVIEVENTLSKQRVSGEIIDAQTVQVFMKGAGMP